MSRKIVDSVEYETKVSPINKAYVRDFIIECKSKGIRPNTIIQYSQDLRIILTYIYRLYENKRLIDLKRKELRDFSIMLQDRGLSPARVGRLLSSLRCCLEYLAEDEEVPEYEYSRGTKIKGPKIKRVRELTYLREDQVEWLKNRLLEEGSLLQAIYFKMSYVSSDRKGEIHQVKKDGLLSSYASKIVEGKGGKEFEVVYDEETQELIKRYMEERGPDDIPELFVKCYKNGKKRLIHKTTFNEWTTRMSKLLSEYEGEPVYFRPHDLRRTRLTHLRDQGVPLEELSNIAHHNDPSTTIRYLKSRQTEDILNIMGIGKKQEPEKEAPAPQPVLAPVPVMIDRSDRKQPKGPEPRNKNFEQMSLF